MADERWVPATFRGDSVFVRVGADGAPAEGRGGLVDFRYQEAGKRYRSRAENFAIEAGAAPRPLAAAPAAPAKPAAKKKPSGARGRSGAQGLEGRRAGALQVWTDGACSGNPGPAGLGVSIENGETVAELSEWLGEGTNNIAELTAILRGIQMLPDRNAPVDIISDSTYCIGLLLQNWKAKKNQALVAELRAAWASLGDAQLIKVKGHAGVPGNERADELARLAVDTRSTQRADDGPIT